MKILLINPPVFNDIGYVMAAAPPLSLLYLAGFLEKNNYKDIKIVDADISKMTWDMLRDFIRKERPDLIGITSTSINLPALIKTAILAKNTLPEIKIIVGGFGPTVEAEKVLKEARGIVDFVVMGEGELTLLELTQKIENRIEDFSKVRGIAYLKRDGSLMKTESREYIQDLNIVPWPAYHLLNVDYTKYIGMPAQYKEMPRPTMVMLASRGCPHRCTFCSLGSKMYRQRNSKDIVDEIEFYATNFGAKSIQLYDDEFIGMSPNQHQWIEKICDEILKRGLHKRLAFLVQGRCSRFVNLEILKKMRQANIVWIWWGVESGSQKILDFIKKDIKVEDVGYVFSLAKQAKIKSLMFIMIGFPGETPADIKLTADLIKRVKPEQARIHIVSPYPGSELRKYLEEHELLETDDYYRFDTRRTVIHHTNEMSAEEIKKYYRMLVFRFENGYSYFLKFFLKSLLAKDGWKNLFRRLRTATNYVRGWRELK